MWMAIRGESGGETRRVLAAGTRANAGNRVNDTALTVNGH